MGTATVILHNFTVSALELTEAHRNWGNWGRQPPGRLTPGEQGSFEGVTDWAGTSGTVRYRTTTSTDPSQGVVREARELVVQWSCPVVGEDECDAFFSALHGGGEDDCPFAADIRKIDDARWVVNVVDNPAYSAATLTPGGSFSGYHGPGCASWGPDRLDLVSTTGSPDLLHRWYRDGVGWSGWETISMPPTRRQAAHLVPRWHAVAWGADRLDAFGVAGGHLEHVWYDGGGPGWGRWDDLGGEDLAGPLAVASSRTGDIDVLAVTDAGSIVHLAHARGAWSQWTHLDVLGTAANPLMIAAASPGPGIVDLFTVRSDSAVWRARRTDAGWSGWSPVGIAPSPLLELDSGSLSAVFDGSRFHLFAQAVGANLVQAEEQEFAVAGKEPGWNDWSYLAAGVDAVSSACRRGTTLHVLARTDRHLVNLFLPAQDANGQLGRELLD
ncbi:hypothetical protein PROP_03309 [Propionicimonas sp. T2.31MG-18]|uniref:hypothetical protein n=1 Tax=Propionicimonas sp. T2.31MG-18 TaxID=3157620 RepID=UPI0035EABE42